MSREFVTKKEFEAFKQYIEKRRDPGTILTYALLEQGGNFKRLLIIYGTFTGTQATITFTKSFKSGTVPTLVGSSDDNRCYMTRPSVSNTACILRSVDSVTQAVRSSTIYWAAIGESS